MDESAYQLINGKPRLTYACGFCQSNAFQVVDGHIVCWTSDSEKIVCCSEFCARSYVHDPDPPRFIDESWLYE